MKSRHQLVLALATAGSFLIITATLKYAADTGVIKSEAAVRSTQAIIGLMLAVYANFIPKQLGRLRGSARAAAHAQSILRVAGWSFTLAGLGYAAIWMAAPIATADVFSVSIVGTAIATTFGGCLWTRVSCTRRATEGSKPRRVN